MEYITVKELFKITKGKKVEEIDYKNENSIRYIQIDDLRNNNNIKHCENINKYVIAKKEDIIIAWDGANAGTIGFGIEGAIGSTLAILRKENKEMDTEFCGLFLRSKSAYLREKCTGATIPHIQRRALEDIKIPKISLNKQIEIKNIINKAQELIDKRKEQIQDLDELVKSQFIEMFGNLKDEEKLPLEKCTTFIDYRGKTPTLSESGIRIINAKSVGNGFFKYIDEYISEETYDSWMKRGFPVAGDVLFVTEGHTFGNVCRIPNDLKKFAMGQRVITMRGKGGLLNNIFLAQYMQSMAFKIDIDKYKTGSSAQGIRSKELQKILIPIPNIELQNKFADFVKQVDKLKFEMEKSLKELEDNFNALMQKAFNGELFN